MRWRWLWSIGSWSRASTGTHAIRWVSSLVVGSPETYSGPLGQQHPAVAEYECRRAGFSTLLASTSARSANVAWVMQARDKETGLPLWLEEHRKRQEEERVALEPYCQDTGLVFTTTVGTASSHG